MLSYEESLQRLEDDLTRILNKNEFTMAGYMDIENLQKCLKELQQYKQQIDELVKWLTSEINKINDEIRHIKEEGHIDYDVSEINGLINHCNIRIRAYQRVLSKLKERDEK